MAALYIARDKCRSNRKFASASALGESHHALDVIQCATQRGRAAAPDIMLEKQRIVWQHDMLDQSHEIQKGQGCQVFSAVELRWGT